MSDREKLASELFAALVAKGELDKEPDTQSVISKAYELADEFIASSSSNAQTVISSPE